MMFDHNSSDLAPQRQMVSAENNTSGPARSQIVQNDVGTHSSASVTCLDDVDPQFRPAPQRQMVVAENPNSGPFLNFKPRSINVKMVYAENNTSGPRNVEDTAVQASVVNVKWRLLKITLQAPTQNSRPHQRTVKFKAGSKSCSLSKQDSYITTRVGITIPPSHSNAEDNSHKVVRLGINPMIQPEPEDLPKDNPKLEIAVLSVVSVQEESYGLKAAMRAIDLMNGKMGVAFMDLFHSCKQYGHVVDSFIPMKRLKDGKRFGFVRFINVFNVERLVNNLCTIWLNRCKLHANIARFNRDQKNGNKYKTANQKKHEGRKNTFYDPSKEAGTFDSRNSFVNVLKGTNMVKETDSSPVIVLEEDCLNSKDLSNSLIGRIKDVGSLSNLKKVLYNEGFDNIFVRYMGELWVLLEFDNTKAKELFLDNVGVGSWFSVLLQVSHDFTPEGRIDWVDVEEIPFKFWSRKTFKKIAISKVHWIRAKEATGWIPEFSEDEEDDDHSEQEFISSEQSDLGLHIDGEDNGASEVPETIFENSDGMKERQSEDPFGLYSILNKNKVKSDVIREVNDENPSLKYPPGFTPSVEKNGSKSKDDQVQNISDNQLNGDNESVHQVEREDNRNSDGAKTNSTGSRKFKMSEIPRTGGSILSVMEEIVKVGITMGYNMDGCANDITKIIESQGGYGVNR
ncbi:nucleotide-binding alpha-beta plait domain-containing protein [Tanacetum coccineum]